MGDQIEGCSIIAKALRGQGVKFVFGVVGIPVIEIAEACMQEGIKYVGMRNGITLYNHAFYQIQINPNSKL